MGGDLRVGEVGGSREGEVEMTVERLVGMRRPGVYILPAKTGDRHPIRRAWGRPFLPPHWTPRADADAAAEAQEAIREFEELSGMTARYTIIW